LLQVRGELQLGQHRRDIQIALQPQSGRHLRKQLVQRRNANRRQHGLLVGGSVQ